MSNSTPATLTSQSIRSLVSTCRWIMLGGISGLLAGLASFVFLEGLDRVTAVQTDTTWMLYLLPVAGLLIGLSNHHLAGRSSAGNALLLEEIHSPSQWVPRRMAPLVLLGTWWTHLFGGSAGREGTALQMSGSLSDAASRVLRLNHNDRSLMLTAALAGGFGSVFGVPFAGVIFAVEVPTVGRLRYQALVPAVIASFVGDAVVTRLGHHHTARLAMDLSLSASTIGALIVVGLACGIAARLFVSVTSAIRSLGRRYVSSAVVRPVLGGMAVVGLAALFGRDYLGLSLPLLDSALAGTSIALSVFALKLLFTAVTIGTGFLGGEVTPLFVIGATLGASAGELLGVPIGAAAAIGMVATFGAAANTPIACTVMGLELFGAAAVTPIAIGCMTAWIASGTGTIYETQRHALRRSSAGLQDT
jgi:H+/Cl- antiporter ClcA